MFNVDQPICTVNDDKLGRGLFAKQLADCIMSFKTEETYAIALQGRWGCGKTSILNMVIEQIENANQEVDEEAKIIVVRFNPWNFTNTTQLVNQFFVTLVNGLPIKIKEQTKQTLGSIIENYSSALAYTEYIPIIGNYLKLIPELGKQIGKTIRANSEEKMNDVAYQKKSVEQELRKLGKRILIIIDDIDRLPNEQIRLIFQLVNSVAGFPNTTYLLSFDKEIVVGALSSVQSVDGMEYLEKIIQIPFDMPPLSKSKLQEILIENLNTIATPSDTQQFDSSRWTSVLYACITPFISNLRDIKRFCNMLSFAYTAVKEEVDFIDMAGICALQVFAPPIFEWIKTNKNSLIGGYAGGGIALNNVKKQADEVLQIFENIYPDNPEIMMYAVASLFPAFANIISFAPNFQTSSELHQEMRIAAANKFDLYFSLSLEDIKISKTEIDAFIFKMNKENLQDYIASLYERDLLNDFFMEIRYHISRIPEKRLQLITSVLFTPRNTTEISKNGSEQFYPSLIDILPELLFRIEDEHVRFEIITHLFSTADFEVFQNLIILLYDIESSYGNIFKKPNENSKKLIILKDLEQLEKNFIDYVQIFMKAIPVLDWKESRKTLILWRYIDESSYSIFIKNILEDAKSVVKFLALFIGTWQANGVVIKYKIDKEYLDYLETKDAIKKIEQARIMRAFWNTGKDIPERMAAFVLLEDEKDLTLETVDADTVKKKTNEWRAEFAAQIKEN